MPRAPARLVQRLADKLRAGRRVAPSMLHQCPCGRLDSFIGMLAGVLLRAADVDDDTEDQKSVSEIDLVRNACGSVLICSTIEHD